MKQNEGTVAADQALVDQQKLNIAYTHITSPVEGRVGLRQVDQGNYITAASTSIVVVTQLHPISVVFTLPEDDVVAGDAAGAGGRQAHGAGLRPRRRPRDRHRPLDTVDNQIDTTTGTVKLRALFDNADEELFPNQFVNAKLTVDTVRGATLVPNAEPAPGHARHLRLPDGRGQQGHGPADQDRRDRRDQHRGGLRPEAGRPRRHRRHRPAEGRRAGADHRGRAGGRR